MKPGDLFFLTKHFDAYMRKKHPTLSVLLTNRIAKLEEIIDWNTEKGRNIRLVREKTGKWKDLNQDDCKYVMSIFYHDLRGRNGQPGVIERGVAMFQNDPETGQPFFEPMPDWVFKEIMKKCEIFKVELDVPG